MGKNRLKSRLFFNILGNLDGFGGEQAEFFFATFFLRDFYN